MVDQTSQFYAILTNVGAAKQANADALGIAWKITQMGVGDANGTDPTPNATQTSLINEWRRAPLNQLKVDDKNSAIIIAEQVIPADVGGKWIREIALYDADGDMVAVANCAPTYKPLLSQGSGRTQVVRMNLVVSSASNVQLKIDPAVVLATREWVTEELARQDFKHSVVAATTAPVSLNGLQTIDSVALTAGARVLVKNQAAAKDNGLYQVVAGGAWTRSADADASAKVTPGMLVLVERGTVNADSAWQLVTDAPITLGVTALAYEMAFGRTGVAAGIYRSLAVDAYGRVTAASNPTTVAGYGLTDAYTKTELDQALALKAPLASPALTGTPTAPTPAAGNNSTQLANTAFVQATIAALIASAPGALDTLNELAAALGNDPNFASTMTNALAQKAPLVSPALSGTPTAGTRPQFDSTLALATTEFVQRALGSFSGQRSINASYTVVPADAGRVLSLSGSGYTITLPATAAFAAGSMVRFVNFGTGVIRVSGPGLTATVAIGVSDTLEVMATASGWMLIGGSALLIASSGFAVSLSGVNGFQKLPSGLIEQWGRVFVPENVATVPVDVTFPMAFPTACLNVVASIGVGTDDLDQNAQYRLCKQTVQHAPGTQVGFEAQAYLDNYLSHNRFMQWRAVGY